MLATALIPTSLRLTNASSIGLVSQRRKKWIRELRRQERRQNAAATKVRKDNESDTEDDVVYEVDSDGEIVWKDY